jgi:Tfp pilus assembly PilM family ATPase
MKNISLPNKELRLLSLQLQNFQSGYTVDQIRSLDKAISAIDKVIQPFNTKLKELSLKEKKDDTELNDYIETEGSKIVTCSFEDTDFEFVKLVWNKMSGLSGNDVARKAILIIDDAIKAVVEPTFTN